MSRLALGIAAVIAAFGLIGAVFFLLQRTEDPLDSIRTQLAGEWYRIESSRPGAPLTVEFPTDHEIRMIPSKEISFLPGRTFPITHQLETGVACIEGDVTWSFFIDPNGHFLFVKDSHSPGQLRVTSTSTFMKGSASLQTERAPEEP